MHKKFYQCGALVSLNEQQILVGSGDYQWSEQPQNISFYFPDFFLENRSSWLTFEKMELIEREQLLPELQATKPLNWEPADRSLFEWQCADLQQLIGKNQLRKGVPYAFERAKGPLTPDHIQRSLKK